jgi:hypothetical protein
MAGRCLARPAVLAGGSAECVVLFARKAHGSCACAEDSAFVPVSTGHAGAISLAEAAGDWDCFCEVPQLSGAAGEACRTETSDDVVVGGEPVDGFCYVDATLDPPLGAAELTAKCPEAERHLLRFVGGATTLSGDGAALVIVCAEAT